MQSPKPKAEKNAGFTPPEASCLKRLPRHWRGPLAGFTIVEVVVMMLIITTISAIVLVSFTGLHEGAALNRSSRELAFAIRRAQNMSLAVTQVDTLDAGPKIPPAVGLVLRTGAGTYTLFADMVHDNKYGDETVPEIDDAKIFDDYVFERGVRIRSLARVGESSQRLEVPLVHLVFAAPEAAVTIADEEGDSLGDVLEIELATPSGQLSKTIVVRTSGQVSIK